MRLRQSLAASLPLLLVLAAGVEAQEPLAQSSVEQQRSFFESRVRPVLVSRCTDCHSGEEPESGLNVDSLAGLLRGGDRGPAIVVGKPDKSLLISAINHGELLQMPEREKLPADQIRDLTEWIRNGAYWPDVDRADLERQLRNAAGELQITEQDRAFWAFRSPAIPAIPAVRDAAWGRNPIDQFVLHQLERAGIQPSLEADRRALLRRVTYDLTGLPPTPEEIDSFLEDMNPGAYERVIDRLLGSPAYGERWGRHWLDVARYADSNGMDENLAFAHAFRYRDYVVSAFNRDLPFDRFVHEQIAGDLVLPSSAETETDRNQRLIATGFLAIGPKMLADDDPRKKEMDIIDEQLDTLCRAFMGMTIGCARCHDHKFDPIPTSDYYSLAGILKSTQTMENFNVVAEWHEYSLLDEDLRQAIAEHEQEADSLQKQFDELRSAALGNLQQRLRKQAAEYARAAWKIRSDPGRILLDGTMSLGEFLDGDDLPPGSLLLQAEAFQRGTLEVDRSNWGPGIGVLLQSGFAEYDLELPAGTYQLEFRYAAKDSRPVVLSLNGKTLRSDAAGETTGGWMPEHQRWHVEGLIRLVDGPNRLRIERDTAVPHLDQLLLLPTLDRTLLTELDSRLQDQPGIPSIIVEAEDFDRGTVGQRPPIIQNLEGNDFLNVAEYDMTLPKSGNYQIELRYASGQSRPMRLLVNGELIRTDAASQSTGGFGIEHAEWHAEAILSLTESATIRLEAAGAIPHIDRVALVPVAEPPTHFLRNGDGRLTLAEFIEREGLIPGVVKAWAARISHLTPDQKRAWMVWEQDPDSVTPDELIPFGSGIAEEFVAAVGIEQHFSDREQEELKRLTDGLASHANARPQPMRAMGVREGQPQTLPVHLRGSHLTLGKDTPRRFLQVVSTSREHVVPESGSGRLQLAQWLTDPQHPLTARVIVNRVWLWHFGEGLVRTPDNFGRLGEPPTHPQLLDWLAIELQRTNWSIKALHRLIVTSSTYRMSSNWSEASRRLDPENRLWSCFPRRRLSAEELRDSLLAVSGRLEPAMGGQLLPDKNRAYVTGTGSKVATYAFNRRSLYLPVLRSAVYEMFQAFDFADPSVLNGQRATTTVTPQALFMMNSQMMEDAATRLADRLLSPSEASDTERLDRLFLLALTRIPDPQERESFLRFLGAEFEEQRRSGIDPEAARREAWASTCRVLLSSNEFVYVP